MDIGQAQIRRYKIKADGSLGPEFEVFAKGLRNSVGLIWDDRAKALLQAENGRDAINKFSDLKNADFPHEELNVVKAKSHYGWPYCFDNNLNNPEWKHMDCSGYTKPHLLLPPHSAPLGLLIYQGKMFPEWYSSRLLAALHGYEPKGHRIVAFKRDDQGLPTGVPQSLVYDWEERGEQGKGKPVSLAEMPDGSVLIVEDDNQNKVLRLYFDPREGSGQPVQEIDQNPVREEDPLAGAAEEARKNRLEDKLRGGNNSPFVLFQSKVIDKTCYECHQAPGSPGVQLLRYDDEGNEKRIRQSGKVKDFLRVVESDGTKGMQMPPQGWDSSTQQAEAVRLLKAWIQKLPK